ncbi:hypothetical protein FF011L_50680 [Roseimaritima multifibrata]|uniref:DUF1573 domain-containing protein n=1 Tax=Roseimaritima multifibrata TaxID=1930274 RepID=A0A517MN04_9BACT|nr:DUF1573 domain-containing protein [Roseimaritima multifibrata]QDS96260.1 hypothetical protein FF011L_50680 [Roseimaritima multifibrata]
MVRFLMLCLLAVVAGGSIGYVSAARKYVWTEEYFGHFQKGDDLTVDELLPLMGSLEQNGVPRVEVIGGKDYDFGRMVREGQKSHQFVLKNVGDGILELSVLKTTCKCTVGSLENASLKPGESTTVDMVWNAKTSGDTFAQTATIATTDPYQGELQLNITGDVVDTFALLPSTWVVGEVSSGTPIEKESRVYNRLPYDLKFAGVEWITPLPGVEPTVDVEEIEAGPEDIENQGDTRQVFRVLLNVPPGLNQGRLNYSARLRFRAADPTDPAAVGTEDIVEMTSLEGRVVGEITLKGGSRLRGRDGGEFRLELPTVRVGTGVSEKLIVLLRGPHRNEAKLHVGEIDPAGVLDAELGEPTVKDTLVSYPLTIRVRKDAPVMIKQGESDDDYGTIWIRSDREDVAPLMLRVTFNVQRDAS